VADADGIVLDRDCFKWFGKSFRHAPGARSIDSPHRSVTASLLLSSRTATGQGRIPIGLPWDGIAQAMVRGSALDGLPLRVSERRAEMPVVRLHSPTRADRLRERTPGQPLRLRHEVSCV
jgi:hypothetical protein